MSVAHSLGGVVSRWLDRREDRALRGIITIGTPHQGAPIANNLRDAVGWLYQLQSDVLWPPYVYMTDYEDGNAWIEYVVAFAFGFEVFLAAQQLGPVILADARTDAMTGSDVINELNSSSNLAREAATMGNRRYALVSESPTIGQFCQFVFKLNWEGCLQGMSAMAYVYMATAEYFALYVNSDDPYEFEKRVSAPLWAHGAYALMNAQGNWCSHIGASVAAGFGTCYADAFIPSWSQRWPDIQPAYVLYGGPIHTEEAPDTRVIDYAVSLLRTGGFGLETAWSPPPPPPDPPVSVVIDGATLVRPSASCVYVAQASGGIGAYTYTWKVNGQTAGNNSNQLSYINGGSPYTVEVTVTSGTLSPAAYSLNVQVSATAPTCEIH